MDYQDCLELREHGFPQKESYYTSNFTEKQAIDFKNKLEKGEPIFIPHDELYVPTLEELIAECGDKFRYLERLEENGSFTGWKSLGKTIFSGGSTPKIAVKNLYCALNPKK